MTVPLVLTGKAVGVTNGGNLHQSMHMRARGGEAGGDPDQARGRRVGRWTSATRSTSATSSWAPACASLLDAKEAIASVVAPKAEKVEEAAAAPVEGAVPAEGAAAPAAGGAAPAAGAAAAPAAGGKKEGDEKK